MSLDKESTVTDALEAIKALREELSYGEGAIRGHPSCVEKSQNTHRCMFWLRMK